MSTKVYKNKTTYKRCTHSEEHPYTIVSNYLIRELQSEDPKGKINFTELGLMVYLLSNADTFIFNSEYTQQKISGIGEDRYYNAINHLVELGYLKKTRFKGGTNWIISEILFHISDSENTGENTSSEITSSKNTSSESTSSKNTSSKNTGITTTNPLTQIEESIIEEGNNRPSNNGSVLGDSDLGSVPVQSLASASQLAPSLHTPNLVVESGNTPKVDEKVFVDNTPTEDLSLGDNTNKTVSNILVKEKSISIVTDVRFSDELKLYTTSKYFSKDNLSNVRDIYEYYAKEYPKAFMNIATFEKVLVYLIITQLGTIKFLSLNKCLKTYPGDIKYNLMHVPQLYKDMMGNPQDSADLLKKHELQS